MRLPVRHPEKVSTYKSTEYGPLQVDFCMFQVAAASSTMNPSTEID